MLFFALKMQSADVYVLVAINMFCRFLSAFLYCLHLVLSDPKGPLASHVSAKLIS